MTSQTLIQAKELQDLLSGPMPVAVVDTRFDLADVDAGERSFLKEHVPGARYAHLDRDLAGPKKDENGRFLGRRATGVDRFAFETLRALDQLIELRDPRVAGLRTEIIVPEADAPQLWKHVSQSDWR